MDDHNQPHHHNHQHPFMISTDLRRLLNGGRPLHFHQHVPAPPELFPPPPHHYDLMHQMVGRPLTDLLPAAALHDFPAGPAADSVTVQQPPPAAAASTPRGGAFDCDSSGFGGDNGSGRWPRQETLTLLEIRSRLDSKFKEANQKGPLWDEVSRIMCDEHGFQRSGKKCREKFENLYKYYKKTKEGKAGRQDGKHYRFFRQLEALCGDTAAQPVSASLPEPYTPVMADDKDGGFIPTTFYNNTSNPNSLSLSAEAEPDPNSSDFESSSSDDSLSEKERKRRGFSSSGKSYWKGKIKGFIDEQMSKLVEKQEVWLEKLTTTLEKKEEERRLREEEWRRQEAVRMERERRFWARERGWIEARDTALVEALQSLTGKVVLPARASFPFNDDHEEEEEEEAATPGNNEDGDHETDNATDCDARSGEGRKKRKGGYARSSTSGHNCNYGTTDHHNHHNQHDHQINERMHASDDHQGVSAANEISCFPFLMGDGDQNFWENYGSLKMMNKGDN